MAAATALLPALDHATLVRKHAALRYGGAVTIAFVLCEAMAWQPTFLAPLLAGTLAANLPMRPPLKLGAVMIGAMTLWAGGAWLLSTLLLERPTVLFGAVALCLFLAFYATLRGAPALIMLFALVCLATIPVIAVAYPPGAGLLPKAWVRGVVVAMGTLWIVHALWPAVPPPSRPPPPPPRAGRPERVALLATAIVMPIMLAFLLFSPTDALPVMVAVTMLVFNFDIQRSQTQAMEMVVGNAIGGTLGVMAFWWLLAAPTLAVLALVTFVFALTLGWRIADDAKAMPVLVVGGNAMLVLFSSSIAQGSGDPGLAFARIAYFSLAGLFAVGAMHLVWHRARARA
jgi:hypothetical protein